MITYERICEKLGCEPKDVKPKEYPEWVINDEPSVWSKLTLEEMLFIKDNGYLEHSPITYREADLADAVLAQLIALSEEWEKENSCHGYRANTKDDIDGNRIFLSEIDGEIIAYLFGKVYSSKKSSVMPEGTLYFEVEELYVRPAFRSMGIGSTLFDFMQKQVKDDAEYVLLSTATKNWKAILHFYIDELNMSFWNARLYKKI